MKDIFKSQNKELKIVSDFDIENFIVSSTADLYSSLYPQEDGVHYTYGAIHYEGGKWVIGTIGDANGWWEGQEPNIENSITFQFKKNDDSQATGTDKTVIFEEYAAVTEKKEIYLGEIAIWH